MGLRSFYGSNKRVLITAGAGATALVTLGALLAFGSTGSPHHGSSISPGSSPGLVRSNGGGSAQDVSSGGGSSATSASGEVSGPRSTVSAGRGPNRGTPIPINGGPAIEAPQTTLSASQPGTTTGPGGTAPGPVSVGPRPPVNLYVITRGRQNNNNYQWIDEIYASGAPTATVAKPPYPGIIAVDGQGDIYYDGYQTGIEEQKPGSSGPVQLTNAYVDNIAVDSPGDLLYIEVHAFAPTEWPAGSQSTYSVWGHECNSFSPPSSCYASTNELPQGLAFGPGGDVYWNDSGAGRIVKVPSNGGPQSNFATGLNNPMALSVDPAGDVFIIENFQEIVEFSPAGTPKVLANGLNDVTSLACDAAGDLFVGEPSANKILEFPADGSPDFTVVNISSPIAIAVAALETQPWKP